MDRSAGVVALLMLPPSLCVEAQQPRATVRTPLVFTRVPNAPARPRAWRQLEAAATTVPQPGRRPARAPPGPRSLRFSTAARRFQQLPAARTPPNRPSGQACRSQGAADTADGVLRRHER